jgi:hypothetical protein
MKMRLAGSLLVLVLWAVPCDATESWVLIRSRSGVDTYRNTETENGYREYKGVVRLDATFEETAEVLKDVPGNVHWMPACRRSEVIENLSDSEILVYIVNNAPWPVRDRECLWKRHYLIDTGEHFLLRFTATNREFKGEEGLVRMYNAHGTWEVTKLTDDTVEVVFEYVGDGGGTIPRGFVNSHNKKLPRLMLLALESRIESLR